MDYCAICKSRFVCTMNKEKWCETFELDFSALNLKDKAVINKIILDYLKGKKK